MGERIKKCEPDQLRRESCSRLHQYELFKIFSQLNSATYIISPTILIKKKKKASQSCQFPQYIWHTLN